jgi:hypothetical protein
MSGIRQGSLALILMVLFFCGCKPEPPPPAPSLVAPHPKGFRALSPNLDLKLPFYECTEGVIDRTRTYSIRTDGESRRRTETSADQGKHVLLLGDALLFGDCLSQGETVADRLGALYEKSGSPLRISNYAFPGATEADGSAMAEALFPEVKPDLVLVGFDPSRRVTGAPAIDSYKKNLEAILEAAAKQNAFVIFVSMAPIPSGPDDLFARTDPYSRLVETLCTQSERVGRVRIDPLSTRIIKAAQTWPRFENDRARIVATYRDSMLPGKGIYATTIDGRLPNPILTWFVAEGIRVEMARLDADRYGPAPALDPAKT